MLIQALEVELPPKKVRQQKETKQEDEEEDEDVAVGEEANESEVETEDEELEVENGVSLAHACTWVTCKLCPP